MYVETLPRQRSSGTSMWKTLSPHVDIDSGIRSVQNTAKSLSDRETSRYTLKDKIQIWICLYHLLRSTFNNKIQM